MDKLIINAAITGMVPMKSDNPNVPLTVDEIVDEIKRCYNAGASVFHVHIRDENGAPTYKGEIFAQIYQQIRRDCPEVLISGTTSGRLWKEFSKRAESLEPIPGLKPDFGSLTLGSLNFPKNASVNEPDMVKQLGAAMIQKGVVPEWECFDVGMIDFGKFLLEKGILKPPVYCNLLLGNLGTLAATPENLVHMVRNLPTGATWSVAGIGRFQWPMNALSIVMGGHVRVGLEDNLHYDIEKTQLATNAGLIERVVKLANAYGREVATPDEARAIIGMPAREQNFAPPTQVPASSLHI
ncbi:MAG: 3-keto-5-aminohexanoate cleavage protein [Cyanobacteria bacterium]|nr:3-keto-5-aminohexanoate cleavage protein [Cyanobacteriota bacterium]